MKKFLLMLILLITLGGILSCAAEIDKNAEKEPYVRPESPHLYWKDIDVVVTDIDKRRSMGKYRHYTVNITVESKEYGITGNCTYRGSGMFGVPHQWEYKIGQTVKAKLHSWVMDSTGQVVRREISQVY